MPVVKSPESELANAATLPWQEIDTVMFDMDGTLLDLYFDSHFWLHHLPTRFSEEKAVTFEQGFEQISAITQKMRGTLNWYCLNYWSQRIEMDILALKREVADKIALRPGVTEFLTWLRDQGKQVWLTTNAHPDSVALKFERVDIAPYFHQVISSHQFEAPKESQQFWQRLQSAHPYNNETALFIDDNEQVLQSARDSGIQHLLGILKPDSKGELSAIRHFRLVDHFDHLYPSGHTLSD